MSVLPLLKESRFLKRFFALSPENSLFKTSALLRPLVSILPVPSLAAASKIRIAGKWILGSMLIACIFLPRLSLVIGSAFRLDLRAEDFLLLILLSLALRQGPAAFTGFYSVEKGFLFFFLAAEISIVNGIYAQSLEKPFVSLLYLLKWIQYFLVFAVAASFSRGKENSRFLIKFFFILGLAIACYGYWEAVFPRGRVPYPNYYRLYERLPFYGDANHVSGLLVLWIAFFTGIYLKSQNRLQTGILAAGLLLVLPPFLLTYSRKSYFALAAALIPAFLIKGSRRRLLILILCYLLITLLFPSRVLERLMGLGEAFASTSIYNSSWTKDVETWKLALWNFEHFWFLGAGFAARHRMFYESQYLMILTETGFAGFAAFLMMVFSPLRGVAALWPRSGGEAKGIAWGWILGFTGMLVHNISCISGAIVKVAVPYWFLAGVVLAYLTAERLVHEPA